MDWVSILQKYFWFKEYSIKQKTRQAAACRV
jgi:hypothetical protein